MLKPLELTIYPLELTFPRGYKLPRDTRITFNAANRMALEKRLTSAELAAEYWHAVAEVNGGTGRSAFRGKYLAMKRTHTLERFAILPHYDEQGTPC